MLSREVYLLAPKPATEGLTLPNDKANLEKVYKRLEKIRNTKIVSNTMSFLSYSLNKKEKKLHNKSILSKFAALFNKIIKK